MHAEESRTASGGPMVAAINGPARLDRRDPLLGRVNDLRTGGLLLYGRHIGGLPASIGTPHTVFDAALNRTSALFLKPKAGTDVALAGLFALLAGFVSESLRVGQVVLRRRSAGIILVIKVTIW